MNRNNTIHTCRFILNNRSCFKIVQDRNLQLRFTLKVICESDAYKKQGVSIYSNSRLASNKDENQNSSSSSEAFACGSFSLACAVRSSA